MAKMEWKKAEPANREHLMAFYDEVIDHTPGMAQFARWKKGLHPTADAIDAYRKEKAMYILWDGKQMVSAMAVTPYQTEEYHAIAWKTAAADDEVAVLHLLAVSPAYQKQGIASAALDYALCLAKRDGKKALRLDALETNTPAQHMYCKKGFLLCGKQSLFAPNTGVTDFLYFEYRL